MAEDDNTQTPPLPSAPPVPPAPSGGSDDYDSDSSDSDSSDSSGPTDRPLGNRYAVEGNDLSGYAGTDPMYQNYANESDRPFVAEGDGVDPEEERLRNYRKSAASTYGGVSQSA